MYSNYYNYLIIVENVEDGDSFFRFFSTFFGEDSVFFFEKKKKKRFFSAVAHLVVLTCKKI